MPHHRVLSRGTAAPRRTGLVAALLTCVTVGGLAAAGPAAQAAPTAPPPGRPGTPTQVPASELLSGLVSLFAEHVYLGGQVVDATARGGASSPLAVQARLARRGHVDAQIALGIDSGVNGAGPKFYRELEATSDAETRLAVAAGARRTGPAQLKVLAARVQQGDEALGKLGALAVAAPAGSAVKTAAALTKLHIAFSAATVAAGTATAARAPQQYALTELTAAAGALPAVAYAEGIATKLKLGRIDTKAAVLRASVTLLLVSHVQQTGLYTATLLRSGPTSSLTSAAGLAEDVNTRALSLLFRQAYGASVGKTFLDGWRGHIGGYATYADGLRTGRLTQQARGLKGLEGYVGAAAKQLAALLPNLGITRLTQDLSTHVHGTEQEIREQAGASTGQYATALAGDKHFADVAGYLSAALVAQQGSRARSCSRRTCRVCCAASLRAADVARAVRRACSRGKGRA